MTKTLDQYKILIVEDEEFMIKALVDNLKSAGFGSVLEARNGEDGLKMALNEKPDLVLLDIVMPRMDGMTMLSKLRSSESGKNVKIIILTNLNADDSIMNDVIKYNPSYYIVKADYSIDDVIKKVKITLGLESINEQ